MKHFLCSLILVSGTVAFAQYEDDVMTPKMLEAQKNLCAQSSQAKTEADFDCTNCKSSAQSHASKLKSAAEDNVRTLTQQQKDLAFLEWAQDHTADMSAELWMYMPGGGNMQAIANAKSEIVNRGRDLEAINTKKADLEKAIAAQKAGALPEDIQSGLMKKWTERQADVDRWIKNNKRDLKMYEGMAKDSAPESADHKNAQKFVAEMKAKIAQLSPQSDQLRKALMALKKAEAETNTDDRSALNEMMASEMKDIEASQKELNAKIDGEHAKIKKNEAELAKAIKKEKALTKKMKVADRLARLEARFKPFVDRVSKRTEFKSCGMSSAELLSIYLYSEGAYTMANSALRSTDEKKKKEVQPYTEMLSAALKKIAPYQGDVLRGDNFLPDFVLAQHQEGEVVEYKAYTSSSLDKPFAGKVQFVIHSKTGRYISPFAKIWGEGEVLFDAGTKFKILHRTTLPDGKIKIEMEEVT